MVVGEDYTPQVEAAVGEAVYEINLAHDCPISAMIFGRRELGEGPLEDSPLDKRILAEGMPVWRAGRSRRLKMRTGRECEMCRCDTLPSGSLAVLLFILAEHHLAVEFLDLFA